MPNHDQPAVTENSSEEVGEWIFSLIPTGVAFAFYVVFILQSGLADSSRLIVYGAAAGFIGVEGYWIQKGRKKHCHSTIVMGVAGILLTLGVLLVYHSLNS